MDNRDEQLNIQVKNQVIQERSLIKVEYDTTFIFQTICTCFGSSLFMQVISLIPSSYNLINQLPIIISLLLIASSLVLVVLKKVPTLKTHLLIIAVFIGLLLGA
ncbi:MAG: hypothetical protein KME38_30730 [Spirirestis rafaelensis WJT71-NPBG6]|jgi:hypothetical protein|nr:hypothetical protein [Spirirestis rafaelensis WJT71-NPBG6]